MPPPNGLTLAIATCALQRSATRKIVINTDAHVTRVVGEWKYGIRQLRRAWLTAADVLNTLPPAEFLAGLRPRN